MLVGGADGGGAIIGGFVGGRFGGAGAGEGEFEQQKRDEAEDSEKDEDEHGAADAVPEAELVWSGGYGGMGEEIQIEIERDANRQQTDGDACYGSDGTDKSSWDQVIEEHLLQGYQILDRRALDRGEDGGLEFCLGE